MKTTEIWYQNYIKTQNSVLFKKDTTLKKPVLFSLIIFLNNSVKLKNTKAKSPVLSAKTLIKVPSYRVTQTNKTLVKKKYKGVYFRFI